MDNLIPPHRVDRPIAATLHAVYEIHSTDGRHWRIEETRAIDLQKIETLPGEPTGRELLLYTDMIGRPSEVTGRRMQPVTAEGVPILPEKEDGDGLAHHGNP